MPASVPTTPVRGYDFESHSTDNPTTPHAGDVLNTEFDRLIDGQDDIIAFARQVIADDGTVKLGALTAVAAIDTDVTAVAGDATDIGTVAGISAAVTAVAGISAAVSGAAANATAAQTAQTAAEAARDLADADATATAADATATAADVVSTTADAVATAADRVQTGLDAVATAADRVQTGIDAALLSSLLPDGATGPFTRPRMTTTARDALDMTGKDEGYSIHNTTTDQDEDWDGTSAWGAAGGAQIGDTITSARALASPEWLPSDGAVYLQSSYPALLRNWVFLVTLIPVRNLPILRHCLRGLAPEMHSQQMEPTCPLCISPPRL